MTYEEALAQLNEFAERIKDVPVTWTAEAGHPTFRTYAGMPPTFDETLTGFRLPTKRPHNPAVSLRTVLLRESLTEGPSGFLNSSERLRE